MVEATGESIYHTVLTTKCSILPRHLLSIIMASLHSIGFSFPEFTRTRFPAKKTYWKTTLGMRVIVRWPQGTPSYKNRFQADSV